MSTRPPRTAGSENPGHDNRRPDIQGLRAIAVLVVIAFHAGLPVPGGFTGVDVFFVISGFVITAMLLREWLTTGRLQFGRFYLRRFKRLAPALALMVSVTMILSALILSPLEPQKNAAKAAIGAMVALANFVIARTTGGYFDGPAAVNPLLNTWSLSVEEQFYLVFPALLVLGWLLARRRGLRTSPAVLVALVAVASFALAVYGSTAVESPGTEMLVGFYSPFTRAWEFAVGALLALALARWRAVIGRAPHLLTASGLAGTVLLVLSCWLITETTPFPGVWTLLPVAGALLLLLAGSHPGSPTTRVLSMRPMVKVGDWSYSLYLWHWPFIVFAIVLWPENRLVPVLAALVSFAPALMSFRWLEQPVRRLGALGARRTTVLIAMVLIPPIALAGIVSATAKYYWTPRIIADSLTAVHPGDLGQEARFDVMQSISVPCTITLLADEYQDYLGVHRCLQSKPGPDVDLAIIGDSHAEALYVGLAEAFPLQNVMYVFLQAWPARDTENAQQAFAQIAARPSIKAVVVNSHWKFYDPTPVLARTAQELVDAGKSVYFTDDIPDFPGMDPYQCKYQLGLIGSTRCTRDAAAFRAENDPKVAWLEQVAQQVPGVQILRTSQYLCGPQECDMSAEGKLMFEDTDHLNLNGTRYLARRLAAENPAFAGVVSGR